MKTGYELEKEQIGEELARDAYGLTYAIASIEEKDGGCDCTGGCPQCEVKFELDVYNDNNFPIDVTHFDLKPPSTDESRRP